MNNALGDSGEVPASVNDYGFDRVVSRRLKHINFRSLVDRRFFDYCVRRDLLKELEMIEVQLVDLETLLHTVRVCPKLKKIDAYLGFGSTSIKGFESVKGIFSNRFTVEQLRRAAIELKQLNKDLDVYLWSLPFNLNTCERVRRFFDELDNAISVRQANLVLIPIDQVVYQQLRQFDRDKFLDEFWPKVQIALFEEGVVDEARFCARLVNCIAFNITLNKDSDLVNLKEAIRSMPLQLRDFSIECDFRVQCGNDVLGRLLELLTFLLGTS